MPIHLVWLMGLPRVLVSRGSRVFPSLYSALKRLGCDPGCLRQCVHAWPDGHYNYRHPTTDKHNSGDVAPSVSY